MHVNARESPSSALNRRRYLTSLRQLGTSQRMIVAGYVPNLSALLKKKHRFRQTSTVALEGFARGVAEMEGALKPPAGPGFGRDNVRAAMTPPSGQDLVEESERGRQPPLVPPQTGIGTATADASKAADPADAAESGRATATGATARRSSQASQASNPLTRLSDLSSLPATLTSALRSTQLQIKVRDMANKGKDMAEFAPGSIRSSVVNVAAATLGAGALSLPYAFSESGVLLGMLVMLTLLCLTMQSIKLIIQSIESSDCESYEELALASFFPRERRGGVRGETGRLGEEREVRVPRSTAKGRLFGYFIEFNMIFFCFGTAVGYAITIGGVLSEVISACRRLLVGWEYGYVDARFIGLEVDRVANSRDGDGDSTGRLLAAAGTAVADTSLSVSGTVSDASPSPSSSTAHVHAHEPEHEHEHPFKFSAEHVVDFLGGYNNALLLLIGACILLPLSVQDKLNELRFASLFGVSCILFLIAVVFQVFLEQGRVSETFGFGEKTATEEILLPTKGLQGAIRMLSLSIFAFCCQPNIPSIYCELEKRSFRRMEKVANRSLGLCFLVYTLMGIPGFLCFGKDTQNNILDNLRQYLGADAGPGPGAGSNSSTATVSQSARNIQRHGGVPGRAPDLPVLCGFVAMTFAVAMAYPLNVFPTRFSIETILLHNGVIGGGQEGQVRDVQVQVQGTAEEAGKPADAGWQSIRFAISAICVALTLLFAILVPSISVVFELVGAFSGSVICFVAPALFFCNIIPGPSGVVPFLQETSFSTKGHAIAVFWFGIFFIVFGTYVAIGDLVAQLGS